MSSLRARSIPKNRAKRGEDGDVALQVMLPPHVKHEIGVRAAMEGTTQRTIILRALRASGFRIADAELQDRRKPRE